MGADSRSADKMKVAITAIPHLHPAAWPRPTAAALYRMAGLAIVIGVPTLFWTCALVLATQGAGIAIGAPMVAAFALFIAAGCVVVASLVMVDRG
jgi:hypothetical protein